CHVDLQPVSQFTRHSPPATLYHLETACGRGATLTGDHNLYVLRDGHLQLIETADARPSDLIPLPESLLAAVPAMDKVTVHVPEPVAVGPALAPVAAAERAPVMAFAAGFDDWSEAGRLPPEFWYAIGQYLALGAEHRHAATIQLERL